MEAQWQKRAGGVVLILTVNKHIMSSMNFVINDKGERTAVLIDLVQLKKERNAERCIMKLMEDMQEILRIELSINEDKYSNWDDAKTGLREKGIID